MTEQPVALRVRGVVLPEGEHRDLYVVDGRIAAEPQPGAELVAEGWVVPGLVDAHCHVGLDQHGAVPDQVSEQQALADRDAGTLLIRDAGSAADTRWIHAREDLPRLVRAGRHLARTRRYLRNFAHEVEPDELASYAAAEARRGDGWVKLVGDWMDRATGDLAPSFPPEAFGAAIAAAHEEGARVTAHVFGADALPALIEAGIDCLEHGTGLTPDLVDAMVAHGTALVPTVWQLKNFPGYAAAGADRFPAYHRHMLDLWARRRDTIGAAHEAGVPLYAGTDAGGVLAHGLIAAEVSELTTYGLSAYDALGAASWRAREWLGFSSTLAEGSEADFCVYDADPLADLAILEHPRRIVLRGRVVR